MNVANVKRGSRQAARPPRIRVGRRAALSLAVLGLAAGCRSSPAKSAGAEVGWYSADAMLVSLRPAERAGVAGKLGVRDLSELPLYDLDVSIDAALSRFTMKEDVWVSNRTGEAWPEVVLRLYANVPASRASADGNGAPAAAPVRLVSGACAQGAACEVSMASPSAVRVALASPLPPAGRMLVHLSFEGTLEKIDSSRTTLLAQGMEGLQALGAGGEGGGNYGLLAQGDGLASFGNFYPVLARRTAAGWERQEKSALGDLGSDEMSHVRARVELPAGARLVSSGTVISDDPAGPGRHAERIAAACVRDFAFVASQEATLAERQVGDVRVRSMFRPSDRKAGEHVLDAAAAALADYEKRFGPYPYPKLDVSEAAIVGGAGGVEFSGLATIASMFYRQGAGGGLDALGAFAGGGQISSMADSMLEFVVAHEVAHQYWHGLVGSDSREHPFADEALAQYSAILYLEDRYGKERAERDGDLNVKANYQMMRLLGTPDAPADRAVDQFDSTIAYAGLVYGKAPYYYASLRRALGDEAFFSGLQKYVATYAFQIAPPGGLAQIMGSGDARVAKLSARWLSEAHGDEDLGQLDLSKLMAGVLGPDAARQLGPLLNGRGGAGLDVKALLKQLAGGQ